MLRRGRGRTRLRVARCGLLRSVATRRVSLSRSDERPFRGPPPLPFNTAEQLVHAAAAAPSRDKVFDDLAKLERPRKHYQRYYGTREAGDNMRRAPQGILAFLRAYLSLEAFLEESFVLYSLGHTAPKGRAPYRLALPPHRKAAEEWVIPEGRGYAAWHAAEVGRRAHRLAVKARPARCIARRPRIQNR